jgi:hypothetical protein
VAGGTSFLLAGGTTLHAMATDGQVGNETSIPAMNDYAQVAGLAAGSGYGVLFWDAKPWAPEDIPPQGPEHFYRADASAAIVAGPATVYAYDAQVPMHDIGARPGGWTLVGALLDHFELRRVDDAGNEVSTSALPITDGWERGHALDGTALAWIVEASNGTGHMLMHADLEAPQPVMVLQGTDMRGPSIARADGGRFVAYIDENVMHLASLSDDGALVDDQVLTAAAVSADTTAPLVAWSPSGVVAVAWHEYSAQNGNRGRIVLVRCR